MKQTTTTLNLSRHGVSGEINELVRARTELECIVEDLRVANDRAGGKKEELEAELAEVNEQIEAKEEELEQLSPVWDDHRARESAERQRLDEAKAHLNALQEKQARVGRFRTRAERDKYLREEIASLQAFQNSQAADLEKAEQEIVSSREKIQELQTRSIGVQQRLEDRREKTKEIVDELASVKEKHAELVERRKELWREDARLTSTVGNAEDELRTAERNLAGMMDKVTNLKLVTKAR